MTVLVAYDGSDPAQKALKHAATTYPDEEIVLLRVAEAAGGSIGAGIELAQEKLRELREETRADLTDEVEELITREDIDFRMEMVAGEPAREIVDFAAEHDVHLIVIGSHGRRGVSRIVIGSVAEKVVRRAPMTVTVVR